MKNFLKIFIAVLLALFVLFMWLESGHAQTKTVTNRLTLQGFNFTPAQVAALPIGSSWYNVAGDTLYMKSPGGVFLWDMTRKPSVGESWQWNGQAFTLTTISGGNGVIGDSILVWKYSNGTGTKLNADTIKFDIQQLTMTASAGNALTISTVQAIDSTAVPKWRGAQFSYLNPYGTLFLNSSRQTSTLAPVATGNVLLSGGLSAAPAWGKVDLSTTVTGVLPAVNGGTGSILTPTLGSLTYGDGTAWRVATSPGTGQFVTWNSSGRPLGYDLFNTNNPWSVEQTFYNDVSFPGLFFEYDGVNGYHNATVQMDSVGGYIKMTSGLKLSENPEDDPLYYTLTRSGNEWYTRRSDQAAKTKILDEGDASVVVLVADTARVTNTTFKSTDLFSGWISNTPGGHGAVRILTYDGYIRIIAEEIGQPVGTKVAYIRVKTSR
jgi:hypothetical protein